MKKQGPTVIIDDDKDEHYLIGQALAMIDCMNEVVFLPNAHEALAYLRRPDVHPFLVISDLNMPGMNGMELRQVIFQDPELAEKCAPYLFFTNDCNSSRVREAYALSIQGFFTKPQSFDKLVETLRAIIRYWQLCMSPP